MPNANPTVAVRRRPAIRLPLLPLPKAGFLNPKQAGQLAKHGRELLRAGEITHREMALLDCLLWSCRRPGQDLAVASYTALAKLVHMARDTVRLALHRLDELGLIERIKRRVRMSWHQGGERSLQAPSCYRLVPSPDSAPRHSETGGRPVNQGIEILYQERLASDDGEAARKALQEIAAVRATLFQQAWAARQARQPWKQNASCCNAT